MAELIHIAANLHGPGRRETVMGRDFLVVPVVMVREQILNNNLGATFLPASAINQAWADQWNAAPAVINHPSMRGKPVSARDPGVMNSSGVGFVYRARAENGELRAEAYIDDSRAEEVHGLPIILERIANREPVEVSTGFPAAIDPTPGVFNGEAYDKVLTPLGVDHLALLPNARGACSVSDGCGLAANHEGNCATEDVPMDEETQGKFAAALDKLTAFLSRAVPPEEDPPAIDPEPDPVANDNREEGDTMNRDRMITALAANGRDKEALSKLSDCDLKALMGTNSEPEPQGDGWDRAKHWRERYESLNAETASAREREAEERQRLVDDLLYQRNNPWSDQEIHNMSLPDLRKVHAAVCPRVANYGVRGGPRADNTGLNLSFVRGIMDGPAGTSALDGTEAN